MKILVGGSRNYCFEGLSTLTALVQVMQAEGHTIHTGCCVGADNHVINAGAWLPSFLVVFAQFAHNEQGACNLSAVPAVARAQRAGAQVNYLAGGPLSVPLSARLIRRSLAALAGCSTAIFFEPGHGSFAVIRHAIKQSIPVYVFTTQLAGPAPITGGTWQPAKYYRFSCWQFIPTASQTHLF